MKMGCSQSTERKLYNEDVDIKRKFMLGIHISKGSEGVEGNFQVALGTTRKKKYEMVSNGQDVQAPPIEENIQGDLEPT